MLKKLTDTDYAGVPERAIVFKVTAWDVNCPQHIPPKYGVKEIEEILEPFKDRIAMLEAEISILRADGTAEIFDNKEMEKS